MAARLNTDELMWRVHKWHKSVVRKDIGYTMDGWRFRGKDRQNVGKLSYPKSLFWFQSVGCTSDPDYLRCSSGKHSKTRKVGTYGSQFYPKTACQRNSCLVSKNQPQQTSGNTLAWVRSRMPPLSESPHPKYLRSPLHPTCSPKMIVVMGRLALERPSWE